MTSKRAYWGAMAYASAVFFSLVAMALAVAVAVGNALGEAAGQGFFLALVAAMLVLLAEGFIN